MINTKTQNLKILLITGANKGIGYGIVQSLLKKQTSSSDWKYRIILTSRDEKRGKEAFDDFTNQFGALEDKLIYRQLDITNDKSIEDCLNWLKADIGQLDTLVNNAGIATKGSDFNEQVFNETFATNVFGTINFTEKILSHKLLRRKGKIIIVGSSYGNIGKLSSNLQDLFKDENVNVENLLELANKFRESIKNNSTEEEGWNKNTYAVSKMIINRYAKVLGKRSDIIELEAQVYACCPGWVRTDMGGSSAHRSLEEGVVTPVYLVELEHEVNPEFQGQFFYDSKVSSVGF